MYSLAVSKCKNEVTLFVICNFENKSPHCTEVKWYTLRAVIYWYNFIYFSQLEERYDTNYQQFK